jgi:LuxR family maltose regulon positive regulatory protein
VLPPSTLLVTELFVPAPRAGLLARPTPLALLEGARSTRLTLLTAPAGGKTTLLSAWVGAAGVPTAWLSLDEQDGDEARFLTYLVAALQTVAPGLGQRWLEALPSTAPPRGEAVLTALVNELSDLPGQVVVVLDDYHLAESAPVERAVQFLVEHAPPQLHLVLSTARTLTCRSPGCGRGGS